MTQPGDVDDPTREYPHFAAGRAEPADGPRAPGDAAPDAAGTAPGDAGGPASGGPAPGDVGPPRFGLFRWALSLGLVVAVLATLLVGARVLDIIPGFDNPFAEERTDRSQPVLLQSMRDLSRYVAAEGNFQVVIDLQDSRENIPDFLLSERTLFVAAGRVPAYVDFATLADGSVVVSDDGKSVQLTLPAPQLDKAALDLERSYVFAEERGLLNRIGEIFGGNPNGQRELYLLAEQRITAAAQGSGLAERAQGNTSKMLEGLLRALGFTSVTVTYRAP